jgi:hypothetical protein
MVAGVCVAVLGRCDLDHAVLFRWLQFARVCPAAHLNSRFGLAGFFQQVVAFYLIGLTVGLLAQDADKDRETIF